MIADEVKINWKTVRLMQTEELGVRNICAKMVPRNLTDKQRDGRFGAVFDNQMHFGDAAASLFTGSRTLRLILFHKVKPALKGHHLGQQKTIRCLERRS
jgi:hypothetical protein